MSQQLIDQFLAAINQVSYHNAAEGNAYWKEERAREKALVNLKQLKAEMVEQYGKEETKRIANSQPHLCFGELRDLETAE